MAKVIIEQLGETEINQRGIRNWPVWEKEVSRFDWSYNSDEECLILEGEVIVKTGEVVFTIKKGDFVTFKSGLECTWDIKKPIKKYYNFP
ncbi:MAG: cupin domain-containing protein [Bacteroidales bacterium]|nr:cupin domain-containing protein [Bacteroidales bacterium]